MKKIDRIRKLVDSNIVEVDLEPIGEEILLTPEFESFDLLFEAMLGPEIERIINIQTSFKTANDGYIINRTVLQEFLDKLYSASCPKILRYNIVSQQSYILYLMCVLLYRYNERVLKMPLDDFINRLYFTNVLTICSKYLIQCRRLFYRLIKRIYLEISDKSKDIIDFYSQLYNADENTIKNDILYLFLVTLITKFNPLNIDNLEEFYAGIFRRVMFFYLKAKTSMMGNCELDPAILQDTNSVPSERYRIYEEALYLSYIQTMCTTSIAIQRINEQYQKMKQTILPNEIQRLYLFAVENGHQTTNERLTLIKIQDKLDDMEHIRNKLPNIYRLLRSIHIVSDTPSILERDISNLQETIYKTLYFKFRNILDEKVLSPILRSITDNLVRSLTTGEFIDMISLTRVNLSGQKFVDQLRQFLEIVLSGLGEKVFNSENGDNI